MNRHACMLSVLFLASCLGAKDHALFDSSGSSSATAGASAAGSASFGAAAGTDSGSGAQNGAGTASAGTTTESAGSGGSGGSDVEPGAGAPATSGGSGPTQPPLIVDCAMVESAVISEVNGHCYRVNEVELTFSEARDACHEAGGHLVTISSEAEDDFAEQLHDGEHWIGATDGRA